MILLIGVIYNVKSNGPNTEPWGTPKSKGFESECVFLILTDCLRFEI